MTERRRKPGEAAQRIIDVTVVLIEAGYASTAVGPIEVFHAAGRLWNSLNGAPAAPRFRVRIASIDGRPVTSLCALGLVPSCAIREIRRSDIIVVPASLHTDIPGCAALLPWLRRWHARGAWIAGICSGVAFLAEAGLLEGRRATTHWAVAEALRLRHPGVLWQPEHFITEDNGVFCSGGVYAALDLSLYMVEKLCGHEIALQCARSLLLSMPRTRQTGYAVLPLSRSHGDPQMRDAEDFLQQHFDRDIAIDELARRAGMGPRNFIRRFKAATGRLPGAYLQALRIAAAKELLEQSNAPIQTVCARAGYADLAFFRRLFKRHTGMTPAEYRRRFAPMSVRREEGGEASVMM
jgi:transcriptional regulator GlxA family with amidase domain